MKYREADGECDVDGGAAHPGKRSSGENDQSARTQDIVATMKELEVLMIHGEDAIGRGHAGITDRIRWRVTGAEEASGNIREQAAS